MITPRFSCSQTEEAVIVSIYCPSVRASDVEIHVDDKLFTTHINPYYLRLHFSHSLEEDDESSASYDPSSGYLTVTLTKAVKGQTFEDLDLLAKLLAPPPSNAPQGPLIEVLDSEDGDQGSEDELSAAVENLSLEQKEILEAAENDWTFQQQVPPPIETTAKRFYGFLDMHSGYFSHVQYSENEVNDLGADAETCTVRERRVRRIKREEEKWDEEHYMADFADDEYIQELIAWRHPHCRDDADAVVYTEEENLTMLRLPRKEYLPTPEQLASTYNTLLTVLFSYAYDSRTTQHDPTSESGWTLSILTPAFSALDAAPYKPTPALPPVPSELAAVFVASYRRSLVFPLYRSFALAEACRADVAALLGKGRRVVLRCLLEMKRVLDHHEVYYVYSKIWMDDLCVWIQSHARQVPLHPDEVLKEMSAEIGALRMEKKWTGWDLEELEALTQDELSARMSDSDDESSEGEVEEMLPSLP
ncbi:SHQ1 protein-domain-containing protein [Cristinia sonorae]|uniref:SHQ1 protein-domain-containing protein n=1 Tax=Cristinia sonorae TaxID=1940300 RepID=A0A8K0V0J6_9AGAR|nr:SHQ1 protein-domain-containing protein [Cristinia sonorae]